MTDVIIFLLVGFGLTNIIVREEIMSWFRNFVGKHFRFSFLNKLIRCETCLGWWIGCGLFWLLPEVSPYIWLNILIGGFMLSAFNKILLITLYKM